MRAEEAQIAEVSEIELKNIAVLLKSNWKSIVLGAMIGLLLSMAYLAITPKRYEARWQLQMAQIVLSHGNGGGGDSGKTIQNIEEPATLIQRLRIPTIYPLETQKTCGMPEDGEFSDYLGGALKIVVVKNVTNTVEMTVNLPSVRQVKECAQSVVEMIIAQQNAQIEERLIGHQEQMTAYLQLLQREQRQLEQIKKSELGNFGYLARLGKLSWLYGRIDELGEEKLLSRMHPAKLVSPIYMSSKPVSPQSGVTMLVGMILGMTLALLYILGRGLLQKIN